MSTAHDPAPPPSAWTKVRVWDLPTRCFHWWLAAAVTGLLVTGRIGGNALVWHMRFGLMVGALLLFRLVWGFMGGRWSRFASFMYAPAAVVRYLKGQPLAHERFDVGHNPLGGFSVFAWLLVLAAQVGTGLFADDEIATTGPLNRFVTDATASLATHWHKAWGQWLIWTLAALHVAAIAYHVKVRRRTLVKPMWDGDKLLPAGTPASRDSATARAMAAVLVTVFGALAAWIARLG